MLTCAHLFILYDRYLGYELFLANPKQAALLYDKSMSGEDIYIYIHDPFLKLGVLYFKSSLIIYNIDRRTLHISTAYFNWWTDRLHKYMISFFVPSPSFFWYSRWMTVFLQPI
jgi:hypothetical protein